jgi:GNAT superfamily N-acetyltransferase
MYSNNPVHIRKAEEGDFKKIIELFKEFAAFERLPHKMNNTLERLINEKEFFHSFVAVTSENEIVGYVTHFFCYYTWTGKAMYMDDLYVSLDYRGKGIGTQLINKVVEYAKETGCHKLRWQVSKWNTPAIKFYKQLGAEIDSIEQNCDLYFD